ncbi:MAG: FHA domain-containing protein [Acidobacteriota bacterium]
MIIECDRCFARYRYDEARFAGKASKKVRCTKCLAIFEIFSSGGAIDPPAAGAPASGEDTVLRLDFEGSEKDSEARAPEKSGSLPPGRRTPAADLKMPEGSKVSLAVIAGPEAGRIFPVDKPRVIIGRQDADVSVEDPEVSRQHAAIEIAGDRVLLLDLGSTNGTFVGDERVTEIALENQSEFSVGGSTLMLIVTARS